MKNKILKMLTIFASLSAFAEGSNIVATVTVQDGEYREFDSKRNFVCE